jgi:hypothetical protein
MTTLFSTDTLAGIVQDLRVPASGLAAAYFTTMQESETEEIHFDVDNKPRRMAPFVSPLVAGKVVQSRGFQSTTFKPAYIKDKRTFTPTRAIKRAMGERIGGGDYSPEQRMQILLVQDLMDQLEMVERRMEWMAAQVLFAGAVTITGDQYPAALVDFGRAAGNTVVKTSGNYWSDSSVNPLNDLQDWSDAMVKATGVALTEVTMTVDVWKVFRSNAEVKTRLDRWRGNSSMQADAHQREGRVFQGMVDQFAIYTYSGWYVDPTTGAETPFLPAGTVLGTAGAEFVEGVRHFGAILDVAVLRAMAYFVKSWEEQDPSVRYLMLQSAPLLVPYRPNATMRAKVLA